MALDIYFNANKNVELCTPEEGFIGRINCHSTDHDSSRYPIMIDIHLFRTLHGYSPALEVRSFPFENFLALSHIAQQHV